MSTKSFAQPAEAKIRAYLARSALPVVIDIGAAWCPPCHMLRPFVHKLAAELAGRVEVIEVDADANAALIEEWKVDAFPTLLFWRAGSITDRLVGFEGYAAIRAALEKFAGIEAVPSAREQFFVAAVQKAEADMEAAVAPATEAFDLLWAPNRPILQTFHAALAAELKGGAITQEEFDRREQAEWERLIAPIKTEFDAAMAARRTASEAFIAGIEAAAAAFAARPSAQVCRPGDPFCRIG